VVPEEAEAGQREEDGEVAGGLQEEEAALVLVEEEAEAAEAFREEEVEDFHQEAEELPEEVSHVDVDNPSLCFVDIWRFGCCLRSSSCQGLL
jgi:hypothetical protein